MCSASLPLFMAGDGGKQFMDAFFLVSRQKFEVSGNHSVLRGIKRVRRIKLR